MSEDADTVPIVNPIFSSIEEDENVFMTKIIYKIRNKNICLFI